MSIEAIEYDIEVLKKIANTNNIMVLKKRLEPFKGMIIKIPRKGLETYIIDRLLDSELSDSVIAKYLGVKERRIRERRVLKQGANR